MTLPLSSIKFALTSSPAARFFAVDESDNPGYTAV